MKKLSLICFSISSLFAWSQKVGVKTTSPTETLDINGSLRVRGINLTGTTALKDRIMVFENDGVVKYVTSSAIIRQMPLGFFGLNTASSLVGNGNVANPLGIASLSANTNQALGWDGTKWLPVDQLSSSNWLFVGNSNTTSTNLLGTINDISMSIRSNNTTMLQFGKRNTLNLYDSSNTGLYPYNQQDNSVSYIRGTNGNSSLQFESSTSQSYKPVFFTTSDGNFGFRGSSAGNDWFEVSSSGSSNNGSLQFTIGDNGDEPIIFRKYNKSTDTFVEMMRMQGLGLNNLVRVGINMQGNVANSTLQINGSVTKKVDVINADTTLTEFQHTVFINNSSSINVTLPTASTCKGRIYILKKLSSGTVNITSFINRNSSNSNVLSARVTQLQSDGSNWQQIN